VEENFELRTTPLKDWTDLISTRRRKRSLPRVSLEEFTKRNIIRLGLETECPHCRAKNWSTLTATDYKLTCERCLKSYKFLQASLRGSNRNFTYRVVGPFSVRDFGLGSYSALLALRILDRLSSATARMTFSTAMSLTFDSMRREVDFVAWRDEERMDWRRPPQLLIGKTKSLGTGELITSRDLSKLKAVAAKLPDSVIVIAVLRDHFTNVEKELLRRFVTWGRRVNAFGQPTNPVLLFTSIELMMEFHVSSTWKNLGGQHAKFAAFEHTRNLFNFADATQQIYLSMPSFNQTREEYWRKRQARRNAARAKKPAAPKSS
jgi:hypothetical protein